MTISSSTAKDTYSGTGSLTIFSYTFRILSDTEILVQLRSSAGVITDQTITTHYTVSGAGDAAGGTITFVTAPGATDEVILLRNTNFLQSTDLTENSALPAETLEEGLDKSTMQAQELSEKVQRSLLFDPTTSSSFDFTLGEPSENASKLWRVNAAGTGLEYFSATGIPDDINIVGSTSNGLFTYTDADNWQVEANLTFDGTDVTIAGTGTFDGRDLSVDGTKLDAIEAAADVTDETNVIAALDGATITTATVATGDKVLLQDVDDSDNLKTVTAQAIADLGSGNTQEQIEDFIGAMVTGNTETNMSTLYQDADGTLDFIVNDVEAISTSTTAGSILFSDGSTLVEDNSDLFWDNTNKRLAVGTATPLDTVHVVGAAEVDHTATVADDHAVEICCDAAGFGDVKALDIAYTIGALSAGEDEEAILINIDESAAGGGNMAAVEVLATGEGSATLYGLETGAGVNPILNLSGTFGDMDYVRYTVSGGGETDGLTAFTSTGTDVTLFTADNDYVIIGDAATFEEIELILDTVASGSGIAPTFWFSTGGSGFTQFTPTDGTNGLRNNGVILWLLGDISGTWATNASGNYEIKIIRTRNSLSTAPIEDLVQIASVTEYRWDKDGALTIASIDSGTWSGDTIAVNKGGTGAATFTDGAILLGSGTGAITALDATTKGNLVVGDGTTDPIALAVGTDDHVLTADAAEASGMKWAAGGAGGANSTTVIKQSNESVTSSTTVQDDDELLLAVAANTDYKIMGFLIASSASATPDIKYTLTAPVGAVVQWCLTHEETSVHAATETEFISMGAGNDEMMGIVGSINNGANAGNVTVQWAQNTSDATATTVLAGSALTLHKV